MQVRSTAFCVILTLAVTTVSNSEQQPPNILLILADDLGWSDTGCYGHRFHETPHIDRLSNQGMRFTQYYAPSPVCSSTRASMLTGMNPARTGITRHIGTLARPFERMIEPKIAVELGQKLTTYAQSLKKAGYVTAHIGKWHLHEGVVLDEARKRLGQRKFTNTDYREVLKNDAVRKRFEAQLPPARGFDSSIVTPAGGTHFYPFSTTGYTEELKSGTYMADFLTDRALAFLEDWSGKQPFFLQLHHLAPHWKIEAKQDAVERFRKKPKPESGVNNPRYAALVGHLDESVGKILKKLDELKLADNTVVIFTSDNGAIYFRTNGEGVDDRPITTNAPLRGEKGSLYEGGIRVPCIVRWPGVVKPGAVSREIAIGTDLLPTLLEIAGASLPEQPLDGVSLLPVLKRSAQLPHRPLFFHYPHYHHDEPSGVVRDGDWKLKESYVDGALELYNLRHDLSETRNLVDRFPTKAAALQAKLAVWRKSVGAKMPIRNPAYDPKRAHLFSKNGEFLKHHADGPIEK